MVRFASENDSRPACDPDTLGDFPAMLALCSRQRMGHYGRHRSLVRQRGPIKKPTDIFIDIIFDLNI